MSDFLFQPPFGVETIQRIIPHRYPFLLVDVITELGPDFVRGYKLVTANEEVFQGHFPGHPVYPGVLQVETVAQAGCCWILSRKEHHGKVAYLMSLDSVKFRRPVAPGDRLDIYGKITNLKSRTGRLEAEIRVDGTIASQCVMMFAFSRANGSDNGNGEQA